MGKDIKKRDVSNTKNQINREKKRRELSKRAVLVIILAMLIALTCGVGSVVSNLVKKTENAPDDGIVEEEIDPDLVIKKDTGDGKYANLVNRLIVNNGCFGIEEYANYKTVTVNDVPNSRAFQVVSSKLYALGTKKATAEEFNGYVHEIFGDEYSFDLDSIDYSSLGCAEYKYDSSSKTLTKQKDSCSSSCGLYSNSYKIYNVYEQNSQLIVDVKVLFGSNNGEEKFYGDYGRANELTAVPGNIGYYYGQGTSYRFTFQQVGGHEVFVSSEFLNEE